MNKPIKTEEDMEKQYQKKYVNKIIQGDCLKIMKTIEDNSIDTIITDPPYNLANSNMVVKLHNNLLFHLVMSLILIKYHLVLFYYISYLLIYYFL